MTVNRAKLILSALMLSAILLLPGCKKAEESGIMVYYINENGTGLYPVSEDIQSGDADFMARTLLDKLSVIVEDKDYYAPIVGDLSIEDYTIEEGRLTIYFSLAYRDLTPTAEALLRASVVQTMVQIDGIDEVSFYVGADPVTDASGIPIGPQTSDSYIYDYGQAQSQSEKTTLTLYYATEDGNSISEVTRTVHYSISQPLEQVVMQYLAESPGKEGLMSAIPEGTNVLSVVTNDGTCYVTLDSMFLNLPEGESRDVSIYAIVNSLCSLDSVDRVQLIVESVGTAVITDDPVSGTYKRNEEIVQPAAE
ncbi:MAG: GerMN domain-containing protein [Lachnospiraceae bacterium]|nr:GerMN domain-containing protein [Lachnospiraceae bacterium]